MKLVAKYQQGANHYKFVMIGQGKFLKAIWALAD